MAEDPADPAQPTGRDGRDVGRKDGSPASRRTRRLPIHGVLVAIDAPSVAEHPWVVDAIDINANGIGLVLPPEVPEGAQVLLSFKLDDQRELAQVPGVVRHRAGASGGVRFGDWTNEDRLTLLEFLVAVYEHEG